MERTPNDERFHVVVAVSPTPWGKDGGSGPFWLKVISLWGCTKKMKKYKASLFDDKEIGGHEI